MQHSSGGMSSERWALTYRRFPSLLPVPSSIKTNGSSPSPVCRAPISMVASRTAATPMNSYVDAIQKQAGNIDMEYVRNDECDDFAQLERFFFALDGPVRNPTNFGWMTATSSRARTRGRRVLLSGLYGNYTISWNGWSQAASHMLHGRLLLALPAAAVYYRSTPYSRWVALRVLLIEPVMPAQLSNWADRRHSTRIATWQDHAPIRTDFAAAMAVDARAKGGTTSSTACGGTNVPADLPKSTMWATGMRQRKP